MDSTRTVGITGLSSGTLIGKLHDQCQRKAWVKWWTDPTIIGSLPEVSHDDLEI